MTDTQTPDDEPYEVGDRVEVRLADDDAESPFEDTTGRVVHVFADGPDAETGPDGAAERELDRAAYRIEDADTGETLPVVLRHRDLVPADGA
jgi:hypothetical protein